MVELRDREPPACPVSQVIRVQGKDPGPDEFAASHGP